MVRIFAQGVEDKPRRIVHVRGNRERRALLVAGRSTISRVDDRQAHLVDPEPGGAEQDELTTALRSLDGFVECTLVLAAPVRKSTSESHAIEQTQSRGQHRV